MYCSLQEVSHSVWEGDIQLDLDAADHLGDTTE